MIPKPQNSVPIPDDPAYLTQIVRYGAEVDLEPIRTAGRIVLHG